MDMLTENKDKSKFAKQFSKWDKCLKDNKVTKIEDLYKKIFTEIRKNADRAPAKKKRTKENCKRY